MKNMFNKANTPYLVSSTLAIATLLASGVFAAAPYVGFLAPVAALSVGLPFIIGGAVFSALVFALSAAMISKNKTISEKDAQLVEQVEEIQGKANQDVKQFRDTMIYASTIALTLAPVIASAFITPVSMSIPTAELSGQQTSPSQVGNNPTVSLPFTQHVPTPQVVLENKANEYEQTLNNAYKSAKNNFGIPQNSSEPQWVKNLNKSETTEEIIDDGVLPNLFYEGNNIDYQFAKPNITHAESSKTVGSNQTAITKYSDTNTGFANYFMGTYDRFLKNLKNSFGSREHPVNMTQDQGTLIDSVKLSKLTTERPIQSSFVMAY